MTYFLKTGTMIHSTTRDVEVLDHLPVGNYVVKRETSGRYYLDRIEDFPTPNGKLYGNTVKHARRILDTFRLREKSTGVLLAGEKGSGKTLLAKCLSLGAAEEGIPTIIVNYAWCGDEFNTFVQSIEQSAVVLFDEFEKVYDKDDQERLLTLLDGVFPTKKLFVLTCNDKWSVDRHIHNRPGRVYYSLDFSGLDADTVRDYCYDHLAGENARHTDAVCRVAGLFGKSFNFDMLQALVEEVNRYGESPQVALTLLNVRPDFIESHKYDVALWVGGVPVTGEFLHDKRWTGNPLSLLVRDELCIDYSVKDAQGDYEGKQAEFNPTHLVASTDEGRRLTFVNDAGDRAVLTRQKPAPFGYGMFLERESVEE